MGSATARSIWYVYGIVPASHRAPAMPRGLDDAAIALELHDEVAALVSELDSEQYAPAALETATGNVEWLSPRAVSHDLVLTWASDSGPVIPLPMFSLFTSRDAIQRMLEDRATELTTTLARVAAGREYALRVYRVDAELSDAIPSLSPRLAALAASAAASSPGQRYLLERKLDAERKTEMRAVSQRVVDEIVDQLSSHARESVRQQISRSPSADAAARGTMVLNAAFLVDAACLAEFQRTLTDLVAAHGAHGFRFDFTGPWPPYHFVGGTEPANRDGSLQ